MKALAVHQLGHVILKLHSTLIRWFSFSISFLLSLMASFAPLSHGKWLQISDTVMQLLITERTGLVTILMGA